MATIDMTNAVHQQMNQLRASVQRYHADPDYRGQVETDPVAAFREQGMELPSNIAVRVLANTDDTRYVIMPPDPNMDFGDEMLAGVAGGTLETFGALSSSKDGESSISTALTSASFSTS